MLDDPLSFFSRSLSNKHSNNSINHDQQRQPHQPYQPLPANISHHHPMHPIHGTRLLPRLSLSDVLDDVSRSFPVNRPASMTYSSSSSQPNQLFNTSSSSGPPSQGIVNARLYPAHPLYHGHKMDDHDINRGITNSMSSPVLSIPSHPLAQRVSMNDSPLQHHQPSSISPVIRNSAPDFSSMGSSGLTEPDRRRRPNVAEAPLSPLPPAPMSLLLLHPYNLSHLSHVAPTVHSQLPIVLVW